MKRINVDIEDNTRFDLNWEEAFDAMIDIANAIYDGRFVENRDLKGVIYMTMCPPSAKKIIEENTNISINVNEKYVQFEDRKVLDVLKNKYVGDGVGITLQELKHNLSSDIRTWFRANTEIVSFDELKFCENVTKIDFRYCTSLKSISLPPNLTTMSYAECFDGCTSLEEVDLGNLSELPRWCCRRCESLKKIEIPSTVLKIGDNAFGYCASLNEIFLNNVQTIGNAAFGSCTSLENINIPNSVVSIGTGCFLRCRRLKYVHFDSQLYDLPNQLFNECVSLSTFDVPQSVKSIGNLVFSNCTSLKNITLPDGLTTIGLGAFQKCAIEQITIPSGVKIIPDSLFKNCMHITNIIIDGDVDEIYGNFLWVAISGVKVKMANITSVPTLNGTEANGGTQYYVPTSLMSAFQEDPNWVAIYNKGRIHSIDEY